MAFCKKCGVKVPVDAEFCPECGARVTGVPIKKASVEKRLTPIGTKRGIRIAGGVLTIVATCLLFIVGFICLMFSGGTSWTNFVGILGLAGFASGLTSGILTLSKKVFGLAIIGIVFAVVVGFLFCFAYVDLNILLFSSTYNQPLLALGLPIFSLSLLGGIFTAVAKRDFR